jgi:hypothetical protein
MAQGWATDRGGQRFGCRIGFHRDYSSESKGQLGKGTEWVPGTVCWMEEAQGASVLNQFFVSSPMLENVLRQQIHPTYT